MIETLLLELATLCLYQGILKDNMIKKLVVLLEQIQNAEGSLKNMLKLYSSIHSFLLTRQKTSFSSYVSDLILYDENAFTLSCEKRQVQENSPLYEQAQRDFYILNQLLSIDCSFLKKAMREKAGDSDQKRSLIEQLPDWNKERKENIATKEFITQRIAWHEQHGAGLFARHGFFLWDGQSKRFQPVKNPDPITLDKLYLVDNQKDTVVKNTEIFTAGNLANNILFYGDRGTGKSSMVKAVANAFLHKGLRLVEVPKKDLEHIPQITSILSERGLKFILFIDDLAFENNEEKYTALKAVLEGSIEYKPANILLYATSNRRHLIKECFSDRKGMLSDNPDEEIRARDTIQEKLSLSDRFGITVVFSSPVKKEYLQIVHKMAQEEMLEVDRLVLEQKAMQWEMAYNGMSPRTARQFIYWMKAMYDSNSGNET